MNTSTIRFLVGLTVALFLLITIQVKSVNAQNEDLKKQIEVQRERNELLKQLKALKDEETAISNGTNLSQPTPTPKPDNTSGAVTTAATSIDSIVSTIEGAKGLFLTSNNTIIHSVCEQQVLEPENYNIYDKRICFIARQLIANKQINEDDEIILDRGEFTNDLAILIAAKFAQLPPSEATIDKDVRNFILDVENKRIDKQVGTDSKGAGSTSLGVKGGIPQFLSWAVENGGVVGSKNGTTLTFRVNPVGFLESLTRYKPIQENNLESYFKPNDESKLLRNISVGFSFDIARGTDPPVFIGSKQQLSAVSFRYNFINQKDPRNPIYKNDWAQFSKDVLGPYTAFAAQLNAKLVCTACNPIKYKNADLEKWLVETDTKLKAVDLKEKGNMAAVEAVRQVLFEQLGKLPVDKLKNDADVVAVVNENGKKLISYSDAKKQLREKIAKGAIVSFEYTNYREVNAPDVSNFRFIAEKGFAEDWNLTANASISFFNKKPSGMNIKRIRDFDFTLQLEKPLMELSFGQPVLSFAGQYQRLPNNIFAPNGTVMMNSKGDIAVGQLKLIIPINGTGIKLPISFTFANRTELVKESTVRGNFGFTFDIDRLLFGKKLF